MGERRTGAEIALADRGCLVTDLKGVKKMHTRLAVAAVMAALIGHSVFAADTEESKPSFWMQKKLSYSEKILAALANEDFGEIAKNARTMNTLNQMERWVRGNTPEYRTQLKIFQSANDLMIHMADDENLDGAALAFVQLTLSCVNCHKIVRASPRE